MSTDEQTFAALPAKEQHRRGRWRAILCGGIILLCGILIGAAATLQLLRIGAMRLIQEPERLPDLILNAMDRKLDLDPEQHTRIQAILSQTLAEFEAQRRDSRPKITAMLDKFRADVGAVLRPEQAEAWYERFDTLRARWLPRLAAPSPGSPLPSTPKEIK